MFRKYTNYIAFQLFIIVLLFSLVLTISITVVRTYIDYKNIAASLGEVIEQTYKSYSGGIADSLWVMDSRHTQIQLEGILQIPYLEEIKVIRGNQTIASAGKVKSKNIIQREYPLATGYSPEMIRNREMLEDDLIVVQKPFSPSDLLSTIRLVLERKG